MPTVGLFWDALRGVLTAAGLRCGPYADPGRLPTVVDAQDNKLVDPSASTNDHMGLTYLDLFELGDLSGSKEDRQIGGKVVISVAKLKCQAIQDLGLFREVGVLLAERADDHELVRRSALRRGRPVLHFGVDLAGL